MMGRVGENEPGQEPTGEWNAEQIRQFQEFQRFQAYLRFTESQGVPPEQQSGGELVPVQPHQPPDTPVIPPGTPGVPPGTPGVPPALPLDAQLASMREQLARIERAANPPWWRKLLRSRLVRWPILLLILAAIGIWGVPALVNHYIGGSAAPAGNGGLPVPKGQSPVLYTSANASVQGLYIEIAEATGQPGDRHPGSACLRFSDSAAAAFARQFGAPNCQAAITTLHGQLTDQQAYEATDLSALPEATTTQQAITISSCQYQVTGGPALGTFLLTRQQSAGWLITGYTPPAACPSTTAPTS